MCSDSSYLGEASAGPVGPLAWGTFHSFQRPRLPQASRPWERGALTRTLLLLWLSAALPTASCGLANQASNALYTEFGCTLPFL